MDKTWEEMHEAASLIRRPRKISGFVEAGQVAAAVMSASGEIYTGVCVDTCSGLGVCAERVAIFNPIFPHFGNAPPMAGTLPETAIFAQPLEKSSKIISHGFNISIFNLR